MRETAVANVVVVVETNAVGNAAAGWDRYCRVRQMLQGATDAAGGILLVDHAGAKC